MKENSTKNIKIVFFLNLCFSIFELIGGIFTNSISIISDSVHDFGDCISIGISYFFERKSKKKPDNKYTYGYLRYSLMGALITSFVLLIGSTLVLYNAIPRLFNPEEVNYNGMLIFAVFGVAINGYAAYKTSKGHGKNEKAVSLHMLEDVLGWVAVLIGSLIMKIFDTPIIDPLLSIGISVYILYNVYDNIKGIMVVFMEKIPDDIDVKELKKHLKSAYKSIIDIHHIHIWTIDGINNYITMHLVIDSNTEVQDIIDLKNSIKHELGHENIKHVTIEIEYAGEKCNDKLCNIESSEATSHHHHHH